MLDKMFSSGKDTQKTKLWSNELFKKKIDNGWNVKQKCFLPLFEKTQVAW